MIRVRGATDRMTTNRNSVPGTAESFFAVSGEKTDTNTATNARIIRVGM